MILKLKGRTENSAAQQSTNERTKRNETKIDGNHGRAPRIAACFFSAHSSFNKPYLILIWLIINIIVIISWINIAIAAFDCKLALSALYSYCWLAVARDPCIFIRLSHFLCSFVPLPSPHSRINSLSHKDIYVYIILLNNDNHDNLLRTIFFSPISLFLGQ